uniref:separase n=1 Tax=Geotrypetes seraphini TaxID=260995 RepID=A0A6P8QDF7_GEOSA|nr:separin [Geotrypetes seraphini]XP_033793935.1 separin [Geotrypetes seraphini]XP_033793936.1 separin [Geotrypetes seraphini]
MKILKGADFVKQTSTQEAAEKLLANVKNLFTCSNSEVSLTTDQITEHRVVFDKILRACNQHVEEGKLCLRHLESLLLLAEMAWQGYMETGPHRTPFYLEKILYHFIRNLSGQGWYNACVKFADHLYNSLVLYNSLKMGEELLKEYDIITKSAFSILWKGAEGVSRPGQLTKAECQEALVIRLQAVRFLMLLEGKGPSLLSEQSCFVSLSARHASAALVLFETQSISVTQEAACFQSDQIFYLLIHPFMERKPQTEPLTLAQATCVIELTMERCKRLCRSSCLIKGKEAVEQGLYYLKSGKLNPSSAAALELCRIGVELQQASSGSPLLSQAAAALCPFLSGSEEQCRLLSGCCQFVISCMKRNDSRIFSQEDLGNLLSFMELYDQLISQQMAQLSGDCTKQRRSLKQQQYNSLQLSTNTIYSFLQHFQDGRQLPDLKQLLNTCRDIVARMLDALEDLLEQDLAEYLSVTASSVYNLGYGLFHLKLYSEAYDINIHLCRWLSKAGASEAPQLPVDRLHKCFRLQVECCKKACQFDHGCEMIALWLIALRNEVTQQMAEPISFWVRMKIEGVKHGNEDLRLKTLRDILNGYSLKQETLIQLLSEELRAYKALHADTGQERYNTICDLLDICSEESGLLHDRAVYLLELAQVLCYHDYTESTDCSALDSLQEALHLLDTIPVCPGNADQLMDDKAQTLLWFHICTIESKMQQSREQEEQVGSTGIQVQKALEEFEPNDLNYEDRLQDDNFVYDGIAFNLVAESGHMKCLDNALALWKKLLNQECIPEVRNTEQTMASLHILASIYRLLGKPLQSIKTYLLLRRLTEALKDGLGLVNVLCQLSKLLFQLECPTYAQVYLEEAVSCMQHTDCNTDAHLLMKVTCSILNIQLCYATQKMEEGVALLLETLMNPALQKSSKVWYLLRVQLLQLLAAYLDLSSSSFSSELRKQIAAQGWATSETALTDAHKLLRSIILLLGNNILSLTKGAADTRFVDYGENLLQKWQVLAELLSCSKGLVSLLSRAGSMSEAKALCLEALKLSMKLQTIRQCAEFLILKAELEFKRAELELCDLDLQKVVFLLESSTDFSTKEGLKGEMKITLRKGKSSGKKVKDGTVSPEEHIFLKGPDLAFVDTVSTEKDLSASPVLKSKLKNRPNFLSHHPTCSCSFCSDIVLSVLCIRWMVAFAEVQVASGSQTEGFNLLRSALERCTAFTSHFSNVLQDCCSHEHTDGSKTAWIQKLCIVGIADDIMAQLYVTLSSLSLDILTEKRMDYIQAGLNFIESKAICGYRLEYRKASLLFYKAVALMYDLAAKHGGSMMDFSQAWSWKPLLSTIAATTNVKVNTLNKQTRKAETKMEKNVSLSSKSRSVSFQKKTSQMKLRLPSFGDVFSMDDSETKIPPIVIKAVQTPIPATPVHDGHTLTSAVLVGPKSKTSFMVFNEMSPPNVKQELPKILKKTRKVKSRLKVKFSDDDLEVPDAEENGIVGENSAARGDANFSSRNSEDQGINTKSSLRKARKPENSSVEDKVKTAENIQNSVASDDSLTVPRRRQKSTKKASGSSIRKEKLVKSSKCTRGKTNLLNEDVELLRTIEEGGEDLEMSFEVLRGSDEEIVTSSKTKARVDGECEVLRRDSGLELENWTLGPVNKGNDTNALNMQPLSSALESVCVSHLDSIYNHLEEAFLCIRHYPPSTIYVQLCKLMALCTGNCDPYTTAFLVSESLSVTVRHQMINNVNRKLRKLKKGSVSSAAEQLKGLVLDQGVGGIKEQHLSELEDIFQFESGQDIDRFREHLQQIPRDVVVCILTLLDPLPDAVGDTLLLTRLEHACSPVNIRIPTTQTKLSLSSALCEFDAIQKEQRETSNLTDRKEWWEGRTDLDRRMKLLIESLEDHVLGCWKGVLLPSSQDPGVTVEACNLQKQLEECGCENCDLALLKVILNGSHQLTPQNVKSIAHGLYPTQPDQAQVLLQAAVDKLRPLTGQSSGHLVLMLDKHLQKLPWENMPCLVSRPVTRMLCLQFLLSSVLIRKYQLQSILARGVNASNTFYILNPHANLPGTEERLRDWFQSEPGWKGVIGKAPTPHQVQSALSEHDLYIYAGHGAGVQFLDGQSLMRLDGNAVSLLFGCSTAALVVRGNLEGVGIILKYIMAGCPLVLGNLWDVTDRDIDRYTVALLQSWIKAGSGAPILKYVAQSRQATKLKHLIGAAPVVYGLPVSLC